MDLKPGTRERDNEQGDDEKDIAARLFATPFIKSENEWLRGLGFGVAGTVGATRAVDG